LDDRKLDQPPFGAAARQDRDEIDGLRNEGAWHGDDRFLNELFESPQRANGGPGMDRADPARMAGAPGFQQIQRLGAADFAHRDAIGPQPQR